MSTKSTKKLFAASAVFSAAMLFSSNLVGVEETAPQDEVQQTTPAAQEIDQLQTRVRALLASESVKDRAWGAYYVGHYRLQAIAPELVSVLTRALENKEWAVQKACIDGLVQTGHVVDNELLNTLWRNGSEYNATYLAANNTAQAAPFLVKKLAEEMEKFENDKDQEAINSSSEESRKTLFITMCNMLMDGDKQKFVETVAPHIRPTLYTHIELPPDAIEPEGPFEGRSGAGRRMGMRFACGTSRRDTTMPPTVDYSLTFSPRKTDVMLAQGPRSVYLRREINKNGSRSSFGVTFNQYSYFRDCLIWLVNPSDLQSTQTQSSLPQLSGYTALYWTSKDEFLNKIETAVVDVRRPWIELHEQLKKRSVLPEDATADALFPVKITYSGHKETVEIPLPSLYKGGKFAEHYLSP